MVVSLPSPVCFRCLSRSFQPAELRLGRKAQHQLNAFSTSAPVSGEHVKRMKSGTRPGTRGRALEIAKARRAAAGRPPAPGERKAARKKIVLGNNNALAVPGLKDLAAEDLIISTDKVALEASHGRVLSLDDETVAALRALETFKPTQGWGLFKKPSTLIRSETVQLAQRMANAEQGRGAAAVREIVFGEKGSGKSVLLLQAHAMALLKGWIVIHVPDAREVTDASTSYEPVNTSDGTRYIQPQYTARLLGSLARGNQNILQDLRLSQQHKLPIPVQSNMSLSRFAELGARDPEIAWPVWTALWKEISSPSQEGEGLHRPPVLVSVDGVDNLMRTSAYLDTESRPIHAFDLLLVSHIMGLLSGQQHLPNGGVVLAAVCQSYRAATPTFDHYLESIRAERHNAGLRQSLKFKQEESAAGPPSTNIAAESFEPKKDPATPARAASLTANDLIPIPRWNPYYPKDIHVEETMKRLTAVMKLEGLNKQEARGIMEYYAQSGLFRGSVTDGLVSEKWALAGGGIVGQMEKGSIGLCL